MKASVIIPNLNGAGWLRDSIESVWAQTEQDFELIVIDNGSTDESLDIARSYCGRDRYTLIENAGNTGFSHAVNQGIAIAKGEYMALFNNDAFAEPDWLAELIKTADADPKIFAVSSLMLRYYEPELADDAVFSCDRTWKEYQKAAPDPSPPHPDPGSEVRLTEKRQDGYLAALSPASV